MLTLAYLCLVAQTVFTLWAMTRRPHGPIDFLLGVLAVMSVVGAVGVWSHLWQ